MILHSILPCSSMHKLPSSGFPNCLAPPLKNLQNNSSIKTMASRERETSSMVKNQVFRHQFAWPPVNLRQFFAYHLDVSRSRNNMHYLQGKVCRQRGLQGMRNVFFFGHTKLSFSVRLASSCQTVCGPQRSGDPRKV